MRVVDGDDAIELRNATGKNILVPGYENEPYLRFLVNGRVEVNVNSPAKYLNEERYGGVTVPKTAERQGEAALGADLRGRHVHLARAPGALDVDEPAAEGRGLGREQAGEGLRLDRAAQRRRRPRQGERDAVVGSVRPAGKADALIAAATAKLKQEQQQAAQAAPADEAEAEPAATPETPPLRRRSCRPRPRRTRARRCSGS